MNYRLKVRRRQANLLVRNQFRNSLVLHALPCAHTLEGIGIFVPEMHFMQNDTSTTPPGRELASCFLPSLPGAPARPGHESIDTTMRYYVGRNAQSTAKVLWDTHKAANPKVTESAASGRQSAELHLRRV